MKTFERKKFKCTVELHGKDVVFDFKVKGFLGRVKSEQRFTKNFKTQMAARHYYATTYLGDVEDVFYVGLKND